MLSPELRSPIFFSALVGTLYLLGGLFPGALNWGFHFLGFLPWHHTMLYGATLVWLLYFVLRAHPEELIAPLAKKYQATPWQIFFGTVFIMICSAVLLRVRAPLLGDGFYLIKNYYEAAQGTSPLYPRDEPLATYYYPVFFRLIGLSSFEGFLNSFLVADILLGAGFIFNAFMITKTMFTEDSHRILAFVFLLALPYMELFFGYVETYPVVLFALSLFINTAVSYLHQKTPFWVIPPVFLVMCLTHYLSSLLIFSLLYLAYTELKRKRVAQVAAGFGIAALLGVGLLSAIDFDIEKFTSWVPYSHLLSILESSDPLENYAQAYTLFSPFHFIDIANLLVLLGAAPLFIVLNTLRKNRLALSLSPLTRFLTTAIVPFGLILFLIKFDLGAARDWDVFSPYFFLLALLAACFMFRLTDAPAVRSYALIILISLTNSFVFYYLNADTEPSIRRFASFFDNRTLSQNGFYGASLQLALYYHQVADINEPVRIWKTYAELFPADERGYQNIINNLSRPGQEAEVFRTYAQWFARDPEHPSVKQRFEAFCLSTGNRFFEKGDLSSAAAYYQHALQIDSTNPRSYNNLGSVFAEQHHYDLAIVMFEKAIALDSSYADALHNLGDAYIDSGSRRRGLSFLQRAARLGNRQAQNELLQQRISW